MCLVDIRKKRQMSQRDLAKALGCSQPRISRLERGKIRADAETLIKLANALNTEIGEIARACLTH